MPPLPARLRFQTALRFDYESAADLGTALSFSPCRSLVEGGSLPVRQRCAVRSLRGFRIAIGGADGRHRRTESQHHGDKRRRGDLIIH
jgi:hypothetical protein